MSESDVLKIVLATVAETFDADVAHLDARTVADDVDGWDSVSHAMLVLALEDRFGVELPFEETIALPDLGALARDIAARLSPAGA